MQPRGQKRGADPVGSTLGCQKRTFGNGRGTCSPENRGTRSGTWPCCHGDWGLDSQPRTDLCTYRIFKKKVEIEQGCRLLREKRKEPWGESCPAGVSLESKWSVTDVCLQGGRCRAGAGLHAAAAAAEAAAGPPASRPPRDAPRCAAQPRAALDCRDR